MGVAPKKVEQVVEAPAPKDDRIAKLERELEAVKAVMRRNGWTLED